MFFLSCSHEVLLAFLNRELVISPGTIATLPNCLSRLTTITRLDVSLNNLTAVPPAGAQLSPADAQPDVAGKMVRLCELASRQSLRLLDLNWEGAGC